MGSSWTRDPLFLKGASAEVLVPYQSFGSVWRGGAGGGSEVGETLVPGQLEVKVLSSAHTSAARLVKFWSAVS